MTLLVRLPDQAGFYNYARLTIVIIIKATILEIRKL